MESTAERTGGDPAAVAREAWETRPARRGADAKFAGVAGALARRYALDPTLVRVAFVVLAVVGGGLLLYLAGWLALPPDPEDPPRREPAPRRDGERRTTLLVVVTVVVAVLTFGPAGPGQVSTVVALMLAALALHLLHTGRAELGVAGTGPRPAVAGGPADASTTPGWDPLGADPRGWQLPPEPPGPPLPVSDTRPRGPRPVLTPVTLALALVAAGAAGAALLLGVPGVTPLWIPAAALAVVGTGLVVGAVRRTGRGLVLAAVPLALATVFGAVAATQPDVAVAGTTEAGPQRPVGDISTAAALPGQVAPEYRTGLGDVDLDLSRLAPGSTPVSTRVESGVGSVTVLLPATADVAVSCASGLGDADCLGAPADGGTRVDLGPDGPGGPQVDLTVRTGLGDVAVRRG